MAKIINVEKSKFINDNIEIYTSNRLGQFSKFLDKPPFYVTYFSINESATTTDLGTGNIDKLFGPNSPLRYNRIAYFPIFNIPDLKPDIEMDDGDGIDISLELNDITFLPNTIKPKPYDLMLIELAFAKQMLFMCNTFKLNSVQSNDFYMADFNLKKYGDDLEYKYLSTQIIDRYHTVYENIGTQDKCFIREDDVEKINTLVRLIELLRDGYINNFYNHQTNSFLLQDNLSIYKVKCMVGEVDSGGNTKKIFTPITSVIDEDNYKWVDVDYRHDEYLYDPFLEKFITSTKMLNDPDSNVTYVLTPNDILQPDFESLYSRTLYWALEQHTSRFMTPYIYCYQMGVKKIGSTYDIFGVPVNSLRLMMSGYDRFMPAEKKVEKALTSTFDYFESLTTKIISQKKFYLEDDFNQMIKIVNRAKITLYEKRTVEEIKLFREEIDNELAVFKTEQQIRQDEIKSEMEMYVNNLDPLTYSDSNIALIQDIYNKYYHIIEAAPFHVYDEAYTEFQEEISEIPQLDQDEIWDNIRKRYITSLHDNYSYYVGEMGLPKEMVDQMFTECLLDLEVCEKDDKVMVKYVDKFCDYCKKLLEGDNDNEDTEPEIPPVESSDPDKKDPENDSNDKDNTIGKDEEEVDPDV